MPVAAIPDYIGTQDLSTASPGMRFGMYLPIWTDHTDQEREVKSLAARRSPEAGELKTILDGQGIDAAIAHLKGRKRFPGLWNKNDHAAKQAWRQVAALGKEDSERVTALIDRQATLAIVTGASAEVFSIDALSTAPFTTGLGNEHPLENGFAFLWPYGLPYLPGSGVKGVLRQAARELAGEVDDAVWDIESEWSDEAITVLFGNEDSKDARRGALAFWDVIPQIKGDKLMVEVMTGHQSHYYMDGETPHDSGQPVPVYFLTVPPGSGFAFHVVCDLPFLRRTAPELADGDRWKALLKQAFEHAFDWLGFGAKTAVGYGAMCVDANAVREREELARQAAFEQLAPEQQMIAELRAIFENEADRGQLTAGCQTAQKRLELLRAALNWEDAAFRTEAAALIRETLKRLAWSKKQKKQGIADELAKLEGKA